MAEKIGISTTAIDKNISTLKNKGLLRRIGSAKGGHWEIIEKSWGIQFRWCGLGILQEEVAGFELRVARNERRDIGEFMVNSKSQLEFVDWLLWFNLIYIYWVLFYWLLIISF